MAASEFLPLFIFLPIAAAISIPEQGKFYHVYILHAVSNDNNE